MEWQSFAKAGHEEVSPNPEEHLILETALKVTAETRRHRELSSESCRRA